MSLAIQRLLAAYRFQPYTGVMFLASVIALWVAGAAWRRRGVSGAGYLALMELAVAIWCFASAWEAAATTVPLKVLWSQIAYLGSCPAPLIFFAFILTYTRQRRYLTPRAMAFLAIVPVLTIVIAAVRSQWVWPEVLIDPHTNIALYHHGLWWWVFVIYAYVLLLLGLVILMGEIRRASAFYRPQLWVILIASLVPIVGNAIYVAGLVPVRGLEWTPLLFSFTGPLMLWGLARHHLLDLAPIARSVLVDTMADGLLVVDAHGRIAYWNPAMQGIAGASAAEVIGCSAEEALARATELLPFCQSTEEQRAEVRLGEGEAERYYDVRMTPLRDARGRFTGRLIVLRDITARKRIEAERERLVAELQEALSNVKTLRGLLPICAWCKRIRDDAGYWQDVALYVSNHTDAEFTHGLCPDCLAKLEQDLPPNKPSATGEERDQS